LSATIQLQNLRTLLRVGLQCRVSKHGRECIFYVSLPPAKMLLQKIQIYGFKMLHQPFVLADRNEFCFPDRAARNCRE